MPIAERMTRALALNMAIIGAFRTGSNQDARLDSASPVRHTLYGTHYVAWSEARMGAEGDLYESLRMELRRGSLTLGVLVRLREERYGYTLRQALAADGLEMEESTLYPLLRRLETQGLLLSEWREEDRRKKRFYRLSPDGVLMLQRLLDEWRRISASLDKIIEP
jgi:DNA-binding PadR family transcriptional regulator